MLGRELIFNKMTQSARHNTLCTYVMYSLYVIPFRRLSMESHSGLNHYKVSILYHYSFNMYSRLYNFSNYYLLLINHSATQEIFQFSELIAIKKNLRVESLVLLNLLTRSKTCIV